MATEKYQNKYRIASTRMKDYDYSSNGAYFVTIVTKNREHLFGTVVDDEMVLNEIGKIVKKEWLISERIRKNIFLDKFVIMPNHFHGIVIIDNERDDVVDGTDDVVDGTDDVVDGATDGAVDVETLRRNVSTVDVERNYNGKNKFMSNISPKKSSLSHMIRSFKSVVTRKSRIFNDTLQRNVSTTKKMDNVFAWQPRFHDRIIRNENELNRIRNYIIKNPEMWQRDRNNGDLWI